MLATNATLLMRDAIRSFVVEAACGIDGVEPDRVVRERERVERDPERDSERCPQRERQ